MKIVEECKKNNIMLMKVSTRKVKAMALLLNGRKFIAYDPTKIPSKDLENVLSHEYYHLMTHTVHRMDETCLVDIHEDVANVFSSLWNK